MTQPPRLAERLVRWSLAEDERDAVLGDLQEEFVVIVRVSPARAGRWYWSQAALSIGPNLARQVRKRQVAGRGLETEEDRKSRLSARKWGLWFLGLGALGSFQTGAPHARAFFFFVIGAVLFVGSLAAQGPVDDLTAAVRRRRVGLFWFCFWLSFVLDVLFGRTPLIRIVEWVPLFAGCTFLVWPQKHWIFGVAPVAPLAPQVQTPFIGLHRARDGSLSLTTEAPETPASLGDPILVRAGESRIGIDRVYTNTDALRVFAVVGEGAKPPCVTVDLLDSLGQVKRTLSPRVQPAELVSGKAPVRDPEVPIAKVDATISLDGLLPGRYVLRLTAVDETHRSDKYSEFRIAGPTMRQA